MRTKPTRIVPTLQRLLLALIVSVLALSCPGSDHAPTPPPEPMPSPTPTPPPASGGTLPLSVLILAATGGTLTVAPPHPLAGTSMHIPAGALARDTIITLDSAPTPALPGIIGPTIDITPNGTVFRVPATVLLVYADATLPPGTAEERLSLAKVEPTQGTVAPLTNVVVDPLANTVRGETSSLSLFAVTAPLPNTPPVANAGPDQTVVIGTQVTLDGSHSSDVDGDPLSFDWTLTAVPTGSQAILSDPSAVQPTFVVDRPGTYVAQLLVNDGTVDSAPVIVMISTQNSRPVAHAGPDQTVAVGNTVQLNGSASSDVDGDLLHYQWTFMALPPGSGATLAHPTEVTPTFVVDLPGTYVVQLLVNDGTVDSAPATVVISTENSRPVAHAGPDQTVDVGTQVTLDGRDSSDADGDRLRFDWALTVVPAGSAAALSDPSAVQPTFVVDLTGTYVAQLLVNDGTVDSAPATVVISTENSRPVAHAGPDQTVVIHDTVHLDGRASSDADEDPLSYRWALLVVPPGSTATLADPAAVQTTFVVDLPGIYIAQLLVNDGIVDSMPDTVLLRTANRPPALAPLLAQTVVLGTTLRLQLHAADPDGDPLTFAVTPLPANASLDGATGLFTFTPVDSQSGTLTLTFTVSDGHLTDVKSVDITVQRPGPLCSPPTITTVTPQQAPIGTEVVLTGQNLAPTPACPGAPQVALHAQAGGTMLAPIARFDATSITIVIPAGAASGPLTVTVAGQSTTAVDVLTIVPSSTFTLTAMPSTADVIQGQSVSYVVTLQSTNHFFQLASLTVTGLPADVTASLTPSQITAGQTALLTINAASTVSPTTGVPFTVLATATVDGITLTQSVDLTFTVKPLTTSFVGRTVMADVLQTPLAGVKVTLLGQDGNGHATGCTGEAVSDAAGNFMFTNLPPTCAGGQLIRYDGSSVTSSPGQYAGVDKFFSLTADQVTIPMTLVHLPRIDTAEKVLIQQNASIDQTFTFSTIPFLQVTVYAGTVFTLEDGSQPDPFPFIAVQVPLDRMPGGTPPPSNTTVMPFLVAFQPANTTASQPVAVTYPNLLNTPPGTNATLITLDPTQGMMVPYGTSTVSADGTQLLPDLDPVHPGRRFGLVHMGWHGFAGAAGAAGGCRCACCCGGSGGASAGANVAGLGGTPSAGKPVNLSFGEETLTETDITINGPRGSIALVRTYRTFSNLAGPFGIGTGHNYSYLLDANSLQGQSVINLITPDRVAFPFVRQPDGTLMNATVPTFRGAVMRVVHGDQVDLRWKDGTTFRFVPKNAPSLGFIGSTLDAVIDVNDNTIALVRNPSRPIQITEIVDPAGRKLRLTYDGTDRVTSVVDPIGRIVRYTYNAQGTLETVTNPESGVTRYDYNTQNRLLRLTDARGVVVAQNAYDANGRVIEQVQADGGVLRFAYTLLNPLVPLSPVLKTTMTDALGHQTTYRFNPQGFLTDMTDALEQKMVFERELGTNLLLSIQGTASCGVCGAPRVGDQHFTYDANGNVLTRTDALGQTTTYTYDSVFDQVTSITDPLNHTTIFAYDARGNLTTRTDENGHTTSFAYNTNGLLTEIVDPLSQHTTFAYDSFGNLVAITDPLGHTTSFRYDAISRQIETVDALGRKSHTTFDPLDRIVAQTNAKNDTTTFAYDPVGNLLSVTDARNKMTTFTYDAMRRLHTKTTPLGKTDTRAHDFNGNLVKFTDRRGQTSQYGYDALNRLDSEIYADGSRVMRVYDAYSRLAHVDDSVSGVFTFTHDLVGRTTNATGPFGTVDYAYNPVGQVASRQVIGQRPVTYAYDPVGNLLQAAAPQATVSFSYDARDQLAGVARSNGVTTTYRYDPVGRVTSLMHANGATILNAQNYTYDAVGNRTSYITDIAQPLITQPRVSVYDDDNRLVQGGTTMYAYDDNGNVITQIDPGGTTTYVWDTRNRLTSISTTVGQTLNFLYDFAGNLIQQQESDTGQVLMQNFILDDLTNIVHVNSSDGDQFSTLTGQEIDAQLAVIQSNEQVEFGLSDILNSTIATTNQSGSIGARFFYEPFGQTTPGRSSYPFQYTGRVPILGHLYYYRARYYDSLVSRFVSEDPIGFLGGDENFYRYVYGNPIRGIDPWGLGKLDLYNSTALEEYILEVYLKNGKNGYIEDTSELIELENSFRKSKPAKECKIFNIEKEKFKPPKPPIDFKELLQNPSKELEDLFKFYLRNYKDGTYKFRIKIRF